MTEKLASDLTLLKLRDTQDERNNIEVTTNVCRIALAMKEPLYRYSITITEPISPENEDVSTFNDSIHGREFGSRAASPILGKPPSKASTTGSIKGGQGKLSRPKIRFGLKQKGMKVADLTREERRVIIGLVLKQITCNPKPTKWASDYDALIVAAEPLWTTGSKVTSQKTVIHELVRPGKVIELEIIFTYRGRTDGTERPLPEGDPRYPNRPVPPQPDLTPGMKSQLHIQALDIMLRNKVNSPGYDGARIGKKFFPPKIHNDTEWRDFNKENSPFSHRTGFIATLKPGSLSVLLTISTSETVLYAPVSVSEWLNRWEHFVSDYGDDKSQSDHTVVDAAHSHSFLNGVKVKYTAQNDVDEMWTIRYLGNTTDDSKAPEGTIIGTRGDGSITTRQNESIWVALQANRRFKFDKQSLPVLVNNNNRDMWLPADKLKIVDWQEVCQTLPRTVAQRISKRAQYSTHPTRDSLLLKVIRHLGVIDHLSMAAEPFSPKTTLYSKFGVKLERPFEELVAHRPDKPTLRFGASKDLSIKRNGRWTLENKKLLLKDGGKLSELLVLEIENKQVTKESLETFRQVLGDVGLTESDILQLQCARVPVCKEQELTKAFKTFKISQKNLVVMVIMGENHDHEYNIIKYWGDCVLNVPTVCVTKDLYGRLVGGSGFEGSKKLELMINYHLALKLCVKLRGLPYSVNFSPSAVQGLCASTTRDPSVPSTPGPGGTSSKVVPSMSLIGAGSRTMIVGATHSHTGLMGSKSSISCVVATNNDTNLQYLASARLQESSSTQLSTLREMMRERYQAWYLKAQSMNGKGGKQAKDDRYFPARILFYQRGIANSQYRKIAEKEKEEIMLGCLDAYKIITKKDSTSVEQVPTKLTLIAVDKNPKLQVFSTTSNEKSSHPGTTIDSTVIAPSFRNFYLHSYTGAKEATKPAHYTVLYNNCEQFESLQQLEDITYNICYTGGRSLRADVVCTPAHYADLLCDRLRRYLKTVYAETMITNVSKKRCWTDESDHPLARSDHSMDPAQTAGGSGSGGSESASSNRSGKRVGEHRVDPDVLTAERKVFNLDKEEEGASNPWHLTMDDIMFYL